MFKLQVIIICLILSACSKSTNTKATSTSPPHANEPTSTLACQGSHGMTPICTFKNPEDMVITPDQKQLLVSEMGEFMLDTPGSLSLFDLDKQEKQTINIQWHNAKPTWGEASCTQPDIDLFSPHGIDLITREDGQHQLLVVNHGGREAIEFFKLEKNTQHWQLIWNGCALPPGDPFINDVAGLQDGGFLVTHMWNKHQEFTDIVKQLQAGKDTGWVWDWHKDTGFVKLKNSDQLMPNGIVVSADNQYAFINIYMASKTIKINLASGEIEGEFSVQQPDNITKDNEGNLWVASHKHDPINQTCTEVKAGPCLLPFDIVKADADTMQAEVVLSHDGEPMGYTTVVLKVANKLYLGSAHGDRIVSMDIPQ